MIILTGGAGFIGSNLLKELNKQQISDIIIVDDIDHPSKAKNLVNLKYKKIISINNFWEWAEQNKDLNIINLREGNQKELGEMVKKLKQNLATRYSYQSKYYSDANEIN